jgi:hypothetical protein
LVFDSASDLSINRKVKILILSGENWIDGPIPSLEDFCVGNCDSDLNLVGRFQRFIIQQLEV